jgi:purine-nucleoside phosphorylase
MTERIHEATDYIKRSGFINPEIGIVLGTGLGNFVQHIEHATSLSYTDIPHFPKATVEYHKGKLIYGNVGAKKVLVMQGRFHYYEGYSMQQITFPIRVMKLLGIKKLLLSNAAGGINPHFRKGDVVVIDDHINLQPDNPLRGENLDSFGPRFPDMSAPYDGRINAVLQKHIVNAGVEFKKGVYASVAGPNLETRAEYRYLRFIGADMVGMSTVPEVIVANHMRLPCAAISVITDECDPDNLKPVNIEEIVAAANASDKKLSSILKHVIADL